MPREDYASKIVEEESTAIFKLTFRDELGDLVIPASVVYHLLHLDGKPVLYSQSIVSLSSVCYIILTDTDLSLDTDEVSYGDRYLLIEAVYNSDLGSGLLIKKGIRFKIRNIRHIAIPLNITVDDDIIIADTGEIL
jgi:hypothetical protein